MGLRSAIGNILNGLLNLIPHPHPSPSPPSPPAPVPPPVSPPGPTPSLISTLLELHNTERAKRSLGPLVLNTTLANVASTWATWMASHENMAHDAGGYTFVGRIQASGYRYMGAGENIAEGQPDPTSVMTAWMNSPGHRANILGNFTEVGFAMVPDASGTPFWCVDFGLPTQPEQFGIADKQEHTVSGPLQL